jgi:hypothetical protein
MKQRKMYMFGTLLALPWVGLLFYLLNPPQCPFDFTQEQVDASRCIVGANIGGMPLFLIAAPAVWLACVWLVGRTLRR